MNMKADASTGQGTPKVASKAPRSYGEAWRRVSLPDLRRKQPCQHLDIRLLAFRE